ncbi:RNA 3'-phosphate cyclase [Candidatus Woesearchaeota archaeon]|nr:RNA 3'-phosphate cyclase [Candidatus Woesearchaeota archaeon]
MLEIKGDYLEGGGQIIRTALALSILTGKQFTIADIRKGRAQPGLKEQHLQTVRVAAKLCNANVQGDNLHSTNLSFAPRKITNTNLEVNISTAGSTALVLQSLLIAGTQNNLNIHIKGGGTWNTNASSIIYFQKVLIPIMQKINYNVNIEAINQGFYPKGGAELKVTTKKAILSDLNLVSRGKLISLNCFSHASGYLKKRNVAERQSEAVKKILSEYSKDIIVRNEYFHSLSPGSGILLTAEFENTILGFDVVGEKRNTAEQVGHEAAIGLKKQLDSKATVDEFMSDQLLPYMALAKGNSKIKINELTKHAETNIWLIKQFLNIDFSIKNKIINIKLKE